MTHQDHSFRLFAMTLLASAAWLAAPEARSGAPDEALDHESLEAKVGRIKLDADIGGETALYLDGKIVPSATKDGLVYVDPKRGENQPG